MKAEGKSKLDCILRHFDAAHDFTLYIRATCFNIIIRPTEEHVQ